MGTTRVTVGAIFCMIFSIIILVFTNLAFPLVEYATLGTTDKFRVIFGQLISPYTTINFGHWWVMIAIFIGAFLGGCIAKSPGAGFSMGFLSFFISFLLFLLLTISFNFTGWNAWISFWNGSIAGDLLLSAGLFSVIGAIGGKITAERD